jgi:phosphopantothenoylcysteine decarboxylase/phosphopantothenate--cysteine ligase
MTKESISTNKTSNDANIRSVLIIISGGVSAYKALELIRMLKKSGIKTPAILTKGGAEFITPLSVSALSGEAVYTDLFSLKDEQEMGHIRLSRDADLIAVIPASANMMARSAHGMADDLASAVLLAADKPVQFFPAMNPQMWDNQATQDNVATLRRRGIDVIEPDSGEVACGETGKGRLPDVEFIYNTIISALSGAQAKLPLSGKHAIVTAGPTYERIDPIRFIGNRSSGKQGYAIAEKLAAQGAEVTLISGPTALTAPKNVHRIDIESAADMLDAVNAALPCDIAICAAAVADWHVSNASQTKLKKHKGQTAPALSFTENPDILKHIAQSKTQRPAFVAGFAAETDDVESNAAAKFIRKGCDVLFANYIADTDNVFGADENTILCFSHAADHSVAPHCEHWPKQSKVAVADMVVRKVIQHLVKNESSPHTDATPIITKLEAI